MNLRTITTRFAVAGVSTAVAAGAMVAAGTGAATAASASGSYDCSAAGNALGAFPFKMDVPLLPPTAPAGMPIAAGLLSYTSELDAPAATAGGLLGLLKVDGGHSDDFAMKVGSATIAAPTAYKVGTATDTAVPFTGTGANSAFSLPKAGTYNVTLPSQFTVVPTSGGTDLPYVITCVTSAPGALGKVTLSKQVSTTAGKASKVRTGYKLVSTVKNEYSTATGKVVAKLGTKSWTKTLSKGKAVFALPKSAKGKKVTLSYKGDGYTAGSKSAVRVK